MTLHETEDGGTFFFDEIGETESEHSRDVQATPPSGQSIECCH